MAEHTIEHGTDDGWLHGQCRCNDCADGWGFTLRGRRRADANLEAGRRAVLDRQSADIYRRQNALTADYWAEVDRGR